MADHGRDQQQAFVRKGWEHLHARRPLAAWAAWRQALRTEPNHPAARRALDALAAAGNLPRVAKQAHALKPPADALARSRWNAALADRNLADLTEAAIAFEELAEADSGDARARHNQALCLAWLGHNHQAVIALELVVQVSAATNFEDAVCAWLLAELLRQGAGAETLADDMNYVLAFQNLGDVAEFERVLDDLCPIRRLAAPIDPALVPPGVENARVFERFDREILPDGYELRNIDELPVRVGLEIRGVGNSRISGPDLDAILALEETAPCPAERFATPLPPGFQDAAVWNRAIPAGLDDGTRAEIHRQLVEDYYESRWPRRTRIALDGKTPLEAARAGINGDRVSLAKLEAGIRYREQLAERPATRAMYQGYPFDRLRRRLGLPPTHPEMIDPDDVSCMSIDELSRLEPESLQDETLGDAFLSAARLGQAEIAARFARRLLSGDSNALRRLDERFVRAIVDRCSD